MKAYVVGGAVRDRLLGSAVNDRDWVVVGATPHELLAAGYTPVGRDFPVFLHPTTREQYALARTERKAGPGYHGFVFHAAPDVTLQQDLARRDLTINAIAEDPDTGELIDPFGGQGDIQHRVLRHVSEAFAEDPVRLLRVARFAARWPDFTVALGHAGAVAPAGERRRSGCIGTRARLAGAVARPRRARSQPHDRGAARVRRVGAPGAGARHLDARRSATRCLAARARSHPRGLAAAFRQPVPRPGQRRRRCRARAAGAACPVRALARRHGVP